MNHELPKLKYNYDALEPYFDAKTMEIHHSKHHQAYTDKFNAALEKHPELFQKSAEYLLTHLDEVPSSIRQAVQNHGGGYYNHSLFWEILGPSSSEKPEGDLANAISQTFENFEKFKEEFSFSAATLFGSGWAWLCTNDNQELKILALPNQDNPLSQGMKPILALDVWEHAYYLKYQNRRPKFIENFWKVVNWDAVSKKFIE